MKRFMVLFSFITFIASMLLIVSGNPVLAANKPMVLKFSTEQPPMVPTAGIWKKWGKDIEARSNGRIKVQYYFGETLVKGKDMHRAVLKGITDIGVMNIGLASSAFRLNQVMELPLMNFANEEVATRIWKEAIEKFPEMQAEFKGTKRLWQYVALPHVISTTKKPIQKIEDFKGMKLAAMGINLKVLEALGASPITLMPGDVYMALERGVADGGLAPYTPMMILRGLPLLKYHINNVLNYNTTFYVMNARKWKKLSTDVQKIIEELNIGVGKAELAIQTDMEKKSRKLAENMGHTFITNTPEVQAQWEEKVKNVQENWIKEVESKGKPGRTVFNEVRKLAAKYSE